MINDNSINSKDKSVLCFESQINNSTTISNQNIYCFEKTFDENVVALIKDSKMVDEQFKKIETPKNILAVSGISDQFDRYSKDPHISHEFQIPIDVIGRSDVYSFYAATYDEETNQIMTWPTNSIDSESFISNTESWGKMISPDKSIPEFSSPLIVFVVLAGIVLIVQFKTKLNNSLFKSINA